MVNLRFRAGCFKAGCCKAGVMGLGASLVLLASCASASFDVVSPQGVDLSGHWRLNAALSDDAEKMLQERMDEERRERDKWLRRARENNVLGLPPVCARRYPLRVDLKHFASALASDKSDHAPSLFQYLIKRIAVRTNSSITVRDFRQWLSSYPWLLVLDGLDEVPASSNRDQVMQAVRDFVSVEAHSADADLLVLATTRPQGYSDEFSATLYWHLALAPLDVAQALSYGAKLATARHPGQPSRIEELTGTLKRATSNPATVRLMQSPLQVTIMLALIEGGGEPPEQRWKLFRDYYDVIYRREKERGTSFSGILGRYEPDIHWVHHRAGWLLQTRNAAAGGTDARLTHAEFEELVDERLSNVGHDDLQSRKALVSEIRLAATDRLVFLVGNTEKEIGFEVRSLQEFMAAEHVFDGGESCIHPTIHAMAPFAYWRNVLLFAAGRIFFERQELIDSVIAVCVQMNDSPDDRPQRLVLSGSRFAIALLKDGATRNQPGWTRALARIGARLLEARDYEAGASLADVFTGEIEEILREDLTQRVSTSTSYSPQNWHLCLLLASKGKAWSVALLIDKYPWATESFFKLLLHDEPRGRALPDRILEKMIIDSDTPLSGFPWILGPRAKPRSVFMQQLESFVDTTRSMDEHWPVRLNGTNSDVRLWVQAEACLSNWSKLRLTGPFLRSNRPPWRIARAICSFAQQPSVRQLVEALREISDLPPRAIENSGNWLYPWQFSVCLGALKLGHSWDEIVAAVDRRDLGSEEDWARWSKNGKEGVPLSAFKTDNDLKVSDGSLGAILRYAGWWPVRHANGALQFCQELVKELNGSEPFRNSQQVLNSCCRHMLRLALEADASAVAMLLDCCRSRNLNPPTQLLGAILVSDLAPSIKIAYLAEAGRLGVQRDWLGGTWEDDRLRINQAASTVVEQLEGVSDRRDVLLALSAMPPLEGMRLLPESYLRDLEREGGAYAVAAQILQLNLLRWAADDAKEIAATLLDIQTTEPHFFHNLCRFMEEGAKNGRPLENMLVELLAANQDTLSRDQIESAAGLLVRLVDRRPASIPLPDPACRKARATSV